MEPLYPVHASPGAHMLMDATDIEISRLRDALEYFAHYQACDAYCERLGKAEIRCPHELARAAIEPVVEVP